MEAKLINPFIRAIQSVITTMAGKQPKVAGKPYLKKDDVAYGDVSSVVGLTGHKNGNFSISFDEPCIISLASAIFGEEFTELNNEVADVVGELANMVSGKARQELELLGYLFHGSIPTVFTGKNHEVKHMTEGPKIGIPFQIENHRFTFEICFEF